MKQQSRKRAFSWSRSGTPRPSRHITSGALVITNDNSKGEVTLVALRASSSSATALGVRPPDLMTSPWHFSHSQKASKDGEALLATFHTIEL